MIQILLATYNGERFLRQQLDSIFSQIGVSFYVIARDDGSSDDSLTILNEYVLRYPERMHLLPVTGERLGAMGSFEALMQFSTADYIAFSDQDDVWAGEKLSVLFLRMKSLESEFGKATPVLVHSDLQVVDSDLGLIAESFWQYAGISPERNRLQDLVTLNTVTGCACLCNRALLGLSLPFPAGAYMHDSWMALCASVFGKIGVEPAALVSYRQHGNNALGAGASRIHKISIVKNFISDALSGQWMRRDWQGILRQPHAFLLAYERQLPENARAFLIDFSSLSVAGFWKKRLLLMKWNCGPRSLLRRLWFWVRA